MLASSVLRGARRQNVTENRPHVADGKLLCASTGSLRRAAMWGDPPPAVRPCHDQILTRKNLPFARCDTDSSPCFTRFLLAPKRWYFPSWARSWCSVKDRKST